MPWLRRSTACGWPSTPARARTRGNARTLAGVRAKGVIGASLRGGLLRGFEGLAALLSASTLPGVNDAGLIGGAPRTWAVVGEATVHRRAGVGGTRLDAVAGRSLVVHGDVASLPQAVRVWVSSRCPGGERLDRCREEAQIGRMGCGVRVGHELLERAGAAGLSACGPRLV
jgi:hypothetical protein